jgi:hypothetical protein
VKTQIVQLEPHDDYISVRDRMEWGQTTRVLLVWPIKGKILKRRLDLTLIKRHSIAMGSQLALVTSDKEVRNQASLLNIPVYKSVRDAEQSRWIGPRKRRKNSLKQTFQADTSRRRDKSELYRLQEEAHPPVSNWQRHPIVRIVFFTLGVLSMLVFVGIFIPSADIFIVPASKTESVMIDINANPEHTSIDISGSIPIYSKSIIVEGRGSTPSKGETFIPRKYATGLVRFINLTDQEITVPAGTIVSTQDSPPIRFGTIEEIEVPINPEGVFVQIESIMPGSIGNVQAGEIVSIEGQLGLNISVTNRRRTSGGTDFVSKTPNEKDYQLVYDQLLNSLQQTAYSEFKLSANPGDVPLSSKANFQKDLDKSYYPEVGEPADFLELKLRSEFQFEYAAEADLIKLCQMVLNRHVEEGFLPRPDSLEIKQLTQPVRHEDGTTVWKMQASWKTEALIDENEAVSLILGLDKEQALLRLQDNKSIDKGTKIILTPDWWKRLPVIPFRIKISKTEIFDTPSLIQARTKLLELLVVDYQYKN